MTAGLAVTAAILLAGWEIFCLTDLARAGRVRFLPRWAWGAACLLQIPLGGILFLLIGQVWQRPAPGNPAPRPRAPAQPGRSSGRLAARWPCSRPVDWPTSIR